MDRAITLCTLWFVHQWWYSPTVREQSSWTVQMYSNMYGKVRGVGAAGGMRASPPPPPLTQVTVCLWTFREQSSRTISTYHLKDLVMKPISSQTKPELLEVFMRRWIKWVLFLKIHTSATVFSPDYPGWYRLKVTVKRDFVHHNFFSTHSSPDWLGIRLPSNLVSNLIIYPGLLTSSCI